MSRSPRVLKAAGISFLVLAAFIGSSHATVVDCTPERFQNGFGESLSAQCPPGSALSTVESCFIDDGDVSPLFDRQWLWGCKAVSLHSLSCCFQIKLMPSRHYDHFFLLIAFTQLSAVRETTCELLEIISGTTLSLGDSPDPTLLYQCPPDYYFRDISSTYDPSTQDRTYVRLSCLISSFPNNT